MLGNTGEEVFDQDAVGIFAELDRRGFQLAAGRRDRRAQLQVRFQAARQAADIVDDDDVLAAFAVLAQERQHPLHAGPVDQAAGDGLIMKHLHHVVALVRGIFPAAAFL